MNCRHCNAMTTTKHGRDRNGRQRYMCHECGRTSTDLPAPSPIAPMRIGMERATMILSLLVEGMSIRATERCTNTHRDTVTRLLVLAGGKCEALLDELVQGVEVENVEADELWSLTAMKQKTKNRKGITDPEIGDTYTFLGHDADSKLILAFQVGERTSAHADTFMEKMDRATTGRFQLTTDGWNGYPEAVAFHLGTRTDYAILVKEYGTENEDERRYSPPRIIAATKTPIHGAPITEKICTSHVERLNLDVRMKCRRFTRLTNAFSRKLANHRAAVALTVAHFNLVKMHSSIRMTPAMKAGVTNRIWSVGELLAA
jgi:transposase-like protein/IS1 family transposase